MSDQTSIELEQILSPETYRRLQAEAERQQAELSDLVRGAIEDYLASEDNPDKSN